MADKTLYTDVIGNISLNNGIVHLDLYNEALPGQQGKGGPEGSAGYVFNRRIIMPVVGFVQSYPLFYDIIKQMEDQGAIKVTPKKSDNAPE